MTYDHILIRYGELGLKGKNQKQFLKTLVNNIRRQVEREIGDRPEVVRGQGRLSIPLNGRNPADFYPALDRVFGISTYSPVMSTDLDPATIEAAVLAELGQLPATDQTFRVTVRRANKRFPIRSMDFQLQVAEKILAHFPQLSPNLTDYDLEVSIDIRFEQAHIFFERRPGLAGLPLGTGGRAQLLLSGGIDSPVAGWLMMRRGVVVEGIHFHSYPYTSKQAEEKVLQLAEKLAAYSGHFDLHLVPFTPIQEAIGANCHSNLRITLMRRIMLRIAEELADLRHAKALVTGDNIGQVASQTIESLYAINEVTTMPVFRPLLTYDKLETVKIAKAIDTYDISVLPYEDCCTVFVPKEPKTKPKRRECHREEARIEGLDDLMQAAIQNTETVRCFADGAQEARRTKLVDLLSQKDEHDG
ncbi:tRNA uracil 4-sulfurtransferase ThiI [Peptococcus simiae]|uniref:tRNA uracil 4-sulfurtransferase ThiI n=1 Tax=Peptococcus simiae TaxID=1643805 RepID=UPI00397F46A6